MTRNLALSLVLISLFAGSCSRDGSARSRGGKPSTAPGETTVSSAIASGRLEHLSEDLVDNACKNPEVVRQLDQTFSVVFSSPEVSRSLDGIIQIAMDRPKVAAKMQTVMEEVVEDPAVRAQLAKVVEDVTTDEEIQSRIEQYVQKVFESPAVDKALSDGMDAMFATPEMERLFKDLVTGADWGSFVSSLMVGKLTVLENRVNQRLWAAEQAGRLDAFMDGWEKAAKSSPKTQTAGAELLIAYGKDLAPRLRQTIVAAFADEEFHKIVGEGISNIMTNEELTPLLKTLFRELLVKPDQSQSTSAAVQKLLAHPAVKEQVTQTVRQSLKCAVVTNNAKAAFRSSFKSPAVDAKLTAFVEAVLDVAMEQ